MDCMNGRLFIAAFLILNMNDLKVRSGAPALLPDYRFNYVLESRPFNLTCIAEKTNAVVWKRGRVEPTVLGDGDGFTISNKVDTPNGILTITSTLSKATTLTEDSDLYRCRGVEGSAETGQQVTVIKVCKTSAFTRGGKGTSGTARLGCSLSDVDASKYTLHWEFMGKQLTNDTKYTITIGSIDIEDPVPADGGEYFCVYKFSESQQVIRMSAFLDVPRTSDAVTVGTAYPLYLLPYLLIMLIS